MTTTQLLKANFGRPQLRTRQQSLVVLESIELLSPHLPVLPISIVPAKSWQEVVDHFAIHGVGCVLVDFDDGPDLIAQNQHELRQNWIHLTVVACSNDVSPTNVVRALGAGCVDLIPKPLSTSTLIKAVDRACAIDAEGEFAACRFRTRIASLTSRELEVLQLFLDGLATKAIAKQLGVSYQTIDKHRNRALKKMDLGNLIELARAVYSAPRLTDWQQCGKHASSNAENPHLNWDQNSERNNGRCR